MRKLRRILSVIMLVALISGCSLSNHTDSKVSFYYSRSDFSFGTEDSIIVSEQRDIAGHEGEMFYILSLYLMGPLDESLTARFPRGTRPVRYSIQNGIPNIELTSVDKSLSDGEFTLASSCLAMTCMELTGYDRITVISGSRKITLGMSDLLLLDIQNPTESTLEESK